MSLFGHVIDRPTVEVGYDDSAVVAGVRRTEAKVHGLGRGIAAGILGGFAFTEGLHGVTQAIEGFVDEALDAQKVGAQTEAVLKSTGGTAHVSAEHVEELGKSLMQLSGVNDENIKRGENMLLTFTKIRNEVGKDNDIFDQATEAVLDMSVAMGRDLTLTSIMVGKALQDPTKGITALRRVGVAFTKDQIEFVKKLVETGHQLEAQKFILRELRTEFGGSAKAYGETAAGALSRFHEVVKNVGGSIVKGLLPAVEKYANSAATWVSQGENQVRITNDVNAVLGTLGDVLKTVAQLLRAIHTVLSPVVSLLGGMENALKAVFAFVMIRKINAFATALGRIGPAGEAAAVGMKAATMAGTGTANGTGRAGYLGFLGRALNIIGIAAAVDFATGGHGMAAVDKAVSDETANAGATLPRRVGGVWVNEKGVPVADQKYWEGRFQRGEIGADGKVKGFNVTARNQSAATAVSDKIAMRAGAVKATAAAAGKQRMVHPTEFPWLDQLAAAAGLTKTDQDDLDVLRKRAREINRRLKNVKLTLDERTTLLRELSSTRSDIQGILDARADAVAEANKKKKAAADKAAAEAKRKAAEAKRKADAAEKARFKAEEQEMNAMPAVVALKRRWEAAGKTPFFGAGAGEVDPAVQKAAKEALGDTFGGQARAFLDALGQIRQQRSNIFPRGLAGRLLTTGSAPLPPGKDPIDVMADGIEELVRLARMEAGERKTIGREIRNPKFVDTHNQYALARAFST